MITCPSCSRELAQETRFCPQCGAPIDKDTGRTVTSPEPHQRISGGAQEPPSSSSSSEHGRFVPGTMLSQRYRIISMLGCGGMGEVYRADDLELGQSVALKLLPEEVVKDAKRLARFRNEVRIARQVSHANVCRVYDLGEIDGQYFISMEYIDGEDLAAVLRRMGRPSKEKADEIARQICAGLAAAHLNGVIHRDLKPANVMIDGRGRVRITDFGLAGFADELHEDVKVGTPAYMAPEQLSGQGVSVKSDIYALGLVLFEVFTGKRAHEAESAAGISRVHDSGTTIRPSNFVDDIDPVVERVIVRCLEKDPRQRPASALAVAAALPGGDPLVAALAAGETPSPEMVALGGEEELLRPRTGILLLVLLAAGMVGWFFLSERIFLTAMMPLPKTPELLADRAAEMAGLLGYVEAPRNSASGFEANRGYLQHLEADDAGGSRWSAVKTGRPPALTFWYRQSPEALKAFQTSPWAWKDVSLGNPPPTKPGMVGLRLDPEGRLLELAAVPEPFLSNDEAASPTDRFDWQLLFQEAGLDMPRFRVVEPIWRPPVHCDERRAWTGVLDDESSLQVRVEAGAVRGRPVAFRVMLPWDPPQPSSSARAGGDSDFDPTNVVSFIVLIIAVLLARRNLRLGRADRRGAERLAAVSFLLMLMTWSVMVMRISGSADFTDVVFLGAAFALFWSALVWAFYMAIEPFIRRRWPDLLTAWTRLLSGGWRDPLVGRDVLIGATAGTVVGIASGVVPELVDPVFGLAAGAPTVGALFMLEGPLFAFGGIVNQIPVSIAVALFVFVLVLMIRVMVRKRWLAIGMIWLLLMGVSGVGSLGETVGVFLRDLAIAGLLAGAMLFILFRFGLLSGSVAGLCVQLSGAPGGAELGAWHTVPMLTMFVVIGVLAAFGFYTSLAGRPLFKAELFDE